MKNIIKLMSLLVIGMASINAASAKTHKDPLTVAVTVLHVELKSDYYGRKTLVYRNEYGQIITDPIAQIGKRYYHTIETQLVSFDSKKEFNSYLDNLKFFRPIIHNKSINYVTNSETRGGGIQASYFDAIKNALNDNLKYPLHASGDYDKKGPIVENGNVNLVFRITEWNEAFVSAAFKR